ncbi:hypothetical protein DMENIID0001_112840 [Sergentomyia squamirostris]
MKLTKLSNKSTEEQILGISKISAQLSNTIMMNYREKMRGKEWIKNCDLFEDGDDKPIYINERLTTYFQLLHKKARDMKRNKLIQYVWVRDGRLFVRQVEKGPVAQIKHQADLDKFK